ncbi:MAG: hypothetical protein HETSPECPRED_006913 [Heterodermia speciosa]|uniref:NmrA-like domain-containing protein n=1 Tax=Heterodermia speciosa TaxID=116794 RepID=A0A8H3FPC7_9LECA|nr:MAG: hypothetical protein HETSPECPRED_006913 [Heterodermia speciosa]
MSEEIKNVLIAGVSEWIFLYESYMKLSNRSKASGNLGPFVLDALNQYPQFTVSVLSRKGSKSTFPSHITVHHVAESYDEEELLPTLKGQDAVISLIRPGQQKEIKSLIDACVKAGVKRFIPGEFGSNSVPEAVREAVPWLQNKLNLVNHLKTKESDGLTWTSVVCGAFFDWGLTSNFLAFSLPTRTAVIYDTGTCHSRMTTLSTIGLAVAHLLRPPHYAASSNRYIFISSFSVTQNEILASLEKATGETWTKKHRSTAETRKSALQRAKDGDPNAVEENLTACHYSEIEGMDYEDEELWNERLGLPVEDVDEVVARVIKEESAKA